MKSKGTEVSQMFPDGIEVKPFFRFFMIFSVSIAAFSLSDITRFVIITIWLYWLYDFVKSYEEVMTEIRKKYK